MRADEIRRVLEKQHLDPGIAEPLAFALAELLSDEIPTREFFTNHINRALDRQHSEFIGALRTVLNEFDAQRRQTGEAYTATRQDVGFAAGEIQQAVRNAIEGLERRIGVEQADGTLRAVIQGVRDTLDEKINGLNRELLQRDNTTNEKLSDIRKWIAESTDSTKTAIDQVKRDIYERIEKDIKPKIAEIDTIKTDLSAVKAKTDKLPTWPQLVVLVAVIGAAAGAVSWLATLINKP